MEMELKYLGKITFAEFGQYPDRPFLFGLQLGFQFDGGGVYDGGKYTVNISKGCKWDSESQRQQMFVESLEKVNEILTDAKVNYVSQLKGKPVQVTILDRVFKDFRILTEVI
jgi:hypothetical protein